MHHHRSTIYTFAAATVLCLTADAQKATPKVESPDIYAMKPEARGRFVHQSIGNTLIALRQVDSHLSKLSKKQLAALRAKVKKSIGECPYTHATFVLLAAASKSVSAFPATPGKKSGAKRDRHLANVRAAIETQWRICERLDVPGALAKVDTSAILRKAPKPPKIFADSCGGDEGLAEAVALLATVKKRVDALPADRKQGIFGTHAELGPATAGLWNFKIILIRCADELGRGVERPKKAGPTTPVADPITQRAEALLRALQAQFVLYC
jgi:hypothetical protein